jgi:hypothetical protein
MEAPEKCTEGCMAWPYPRVMGAICDDRLDETRRAWIGAHQGFSIIQRRRAELLGRRIRDRQRTHASVVVDPHDDTVVPPLWLRAAKSPGSRFELLGVTGLAFVAPLGWIVGRLLARRIARLIPNILRAFPIAALLWSGAVVGFFVVALYSPGADLGQAVLMPWLCVQVAAVPAVAGVHGILEGWLAVAGSDRWWPITPPPRPISADDAAAILGCNVVLSTGETSEES